VRPRDVFAVVVVAAATIYGIVAIAITEAGGDFDYVINGGFESGVAGWMAPRATLLTRSNGDAAAGDASLSISGTGSFQARHTLTSAPGAGTYRLSFSARASSADVVARVVLELVDPYPHQLAHEFNAATDGWVHVTREITLESASSVTLVFTGTFSPGASLLLDDVRFLGPPPVSITPTFTSTPPPSATPTPASPTPTAAASPEPITSELRNPGFEDVRVDGAPASWDKYGGTLIGTTAYAHSGAHSARLESATDATKWLYQTVLIEPAATYEFGAWVLADHPGVASASLRISWYASSDGTGAALDTVDSLDALRSPSASFRYLRTGPVAAPPDARSANLRVLLAPASAAYADIYVDDARFAPAIAIPPTATATSTAAPARNIAADDGESHRSGGAARAGSGRSTRRSVAGVSGEPLATSRIVLNEVLYDAISDGPDAENEWIEIYNAGGQPVDLDGWQIADASSARVVPPGRIDPGGFLVVAASPRFRDAYASFTGQVVVLGGRIGNGLGNDGDTLSLLDPGGNMVDSLSWGDDASAFDPAVDDVPAGHSIEREPAGADTNTAGDWIDNDQPSPGASFVRAPRPRGGRHVRIIEDAAGDRYDWVPWALMAASSAALAVVLGRHGAAALRERVRRS
jgi:hypothetical protein